MSRTPKLSLSFQLRMVEGEAKKNQAILEQQIEILESQIAETKRREQNLTQMNETIMVALNEMNNGAKDAKMVNTNSQPWKALMPTP